MNSIHRSMLAALLTTMLLGVSPAVARSNDSGGEMIAVTYARPGVLLDLDDGRALNMRCSGEGQPVVVLEAGGNAESSTWYRVQPQLARLTRVCAYDRAGYGFSDEGPYPRNLEANVADLRALIQTAHISSPVLLVGHSLGSSIVRRYAQRYPEGVAALVLVDPPEQGADQQMPQNWQSQVAAMLEQREAFLSVCERAAVAGDAETLQGKCLREPPAWMSEPVASAMQRNKAKPSYWRTLRSELEHGAALFALPVPADESYAATPLVLLAAIDQRDDAPEETRAILQASRRQTHAQILAASTASRLIEVPGASHDIQLDRPDSVVTAVRQLLGK